MDDKDILVNLKKNNPALYARLIAPKTDKDVGNSGDPLHDYIGLFYCRHGEGIGGILQDAEGIYLLWHGAVIRGDADIPCRCERGRTPWRPSQLKEELNEKNGL
jgi:hypothetical protein